jgi:predicted house-cleaning noncanonical NTP pyrophosphatase (MazG superfamily)
LKEEVGKYLDLQTIEQLGNILDTVYDILEHNNVKIEDFESFVKDKVDKQGSYDRRYFLKEIVDTKK